MRVIELSPHEIDEGVKLLNDATARFPDVPTDINLFFGFHSAANDLNPCFEGAVRSADVLVLETVGWTREGAKLRQSISDGDEEALGQYDRHLEQLGGQGDFWRSVNRAVFKSGVRLHYPDVPQGHKYTADYIRAAQEESGISLALSNKIVQSDEITTGEMLKSATKLFSTYQKRDRYILKHFFPKETPEPKIEALNIVGLFGVIHNRIGPALSRQASLQSRPDVAVRINTEDMPSLVSAYNNFLSRQAISRTQLLDFFTANKN